MINPFANYAAIALLAGLGTPLFAGNYATPMSEQDLRGLVPFGADATLKFAECGKKTYPTCTYIGGEPDSDDAARLKLGGKPEGDQLMTIFAQAHSPQDFDRVLASYKDALPLDDLGVKAVWSARRNQLSLITGDNLVIHVNVQIRALADLKGKAEQIATFLLGNR